MKYMILTFGDQSSLADKPKEWIREMVDFMKQIDVDMRESGELVYEEGLVDPSQAKTVRWVNGAATPTDGPFMEPSRSLAGFWVVDVADEARALEIASKIVDFIQAPIEVRQVGEAPEV